MGIWGGWKQSFAGRLGNGGGSLATTREGEVGGAHGSSSWSLNTLSCQRSPPREASQPHNLGWVQHGECLSPDLGGGRGSMKPPEAHDSILGDSGCTGVSEMRLDAECFETIGLEGSVGVGWGR